MQAQRLIGATINLVNAVASAGTTTSLTTTTATTCCIKGKFATAFASGTNTAVTWGNDAATGNAFIPLVSTTTGGQAACLVIGINAAGAAKMCQGPITATALGVTTTAGAFLASPQFPELPDDFCPICYTIVRTSPTGNSFTASTTGWAASGITCSAFQNIAVLPDRPQTT